MMQRCPQITEEGGEDTGVGKLTEIQIRSQAEAGRGQFHSFNFSISELFRVSFFQSISEQHSLLAALVRIHGWSTPIQQFSL